MDAFNASKQKLSLAHELPLVKFICRSADHSLPLSRSEVKCYADAMIQQEKGDTIDDKYHVADLWMDSFLMRHHEKLGTFWGRSLDTQRVKCLNPVAVEHWFTLVKKYIVDKGILPENIYGMDESGFSPADQSVRWVIGWKGTKTQHRSGTANRENVTALVKICADGTTIALTVIFKAKSFQKTWGDNNVAGAS